MAAAALENFPASHFIHFLAPELGLNEPSVHASHSVAPAASAILPESHIVQLAAPFPEYDPDSQVRHSLVAAYFPATHWSHSVAPTIETLPESHFVQIAALAADICPAAQGVHDDAPLFGLYVPAAQTSALELAAKGANLPAGASRQSL